MKYKSFDPEAKILGRAMLGIRAAIRQDIIEPLLVKNGVLDIQPSEWYPVQKWLDVLTEIFMGEDNVSRLFAFVDIGQALAKTTRFVSEEEEAAIRENKNKFIEFLTVIGPSTYLADHQGYVGGLIGEKINDNHVKITIITPYPPDLWYGVLYASSMRFGNSRWTIEYEDVAMRNATKGEPVIIHAKYQ